MPFPQQAPMPFTSDTILEIHPGQNGCYGLFKNGSWVYVGKGDIRQRLLDHLYGDNYCINMQSPTHFVTEVTSNMDWREKQLILELKPTCNQRVG